MNKRFKFLTPWKWNVAKIQSEWKNEDDALTVLHFYFQFVDTYKLENSFD